MVTYLFWAMAVLSCGYAATFGGRDGRAAALLFAGATLLTLFAQSLDTAWQGTQWPVMIVDCLYLAGIYWLALQSSHFWPIWMTGFHLVTVVTHLSTLLGSAYVPKIYAAMSTFWVIPILGSMVVGIMLDRRPLERAAPRQGASR